MYSSEPGDQGVPLLWVVRELLLVPLVMSHRPWRQIGDSPDREGESRQRPGCNRETSPLNHLSKVIGARNVLVKSSVGDLVASLPGLAQPEEDLVCLIVDISAEEEKREAHKGPGGAKP